MDSKRNPPNISAEEPPPKKRHHHMVGNFQVIGPSLIDNKDILQERCSRILYTVFPEKIKKLDNMFQSDPRFTLERSKVPDQIVVPDGTTPDRAYTVSVPCNKKIVAMMDALRVELLDMADSLSHLGLWVKLNVPRAEDGNNFGVQVQSEVLDVLGTVETSCLGVLDTFAAYHASRAKSVQKVLKWPLLEDHRVAVSQMDEKIYIKGRLVVSDLRTNYVVLYDVITKNLEHLLLPRGTYDESKTLQYT